MILAIVALSFITFAVTSHFLNLYGSFLDTASSTIHTRSESILLRAERPPLRVAIFTAAGNGNLGDNLQIHSWTSHFNAWNMRKYGGRRKIDIYSLSGEFCCYPFDDRRKLVVDSLESLTQFLSKHQPHYMIIGGGGIFGHPHRPFDTRNVTWSQVVAQFPNVKWIIASVGAGEDISEDLTARVSSLIDHAKVVTGRDGPSQQMLQKHISDKNRRVTLLRDPVLVDEEHFPFPPISNDFEHEGASSKQTCWILRKPLTEELVSLMKPHINLEKDLLLAMEEQDKVLDNIFHRKHISVFPTGGQWLWDNLQKHCAYVVTMRFHGAILAFRSQVPTLAIEPLSRKIIQLYQDVYGNTDCVMTHINEKEFAEKFHKCRSVNPSPIVPVLKEMRKQFDQFMDTTFD
ncbi:hypothetical protein C9374_001929 [Naegleria lovaniensis]|uniref:Polysaccharide pyruvyl transferase domain-containing protein n=1 Tax=Naegleria lovaniensis TaxID=51637 RepID=A0AA88GVG0_NAELO|nr:uncharacterized protein C9374_001929 [Naegleria lovaniensis]KAG2386894.1 hypothetical protein C9374_001929 [Naegleria lovaniensis]